MNRTEGDDRGGAAQWPAGDTAARAEPAAWLFFRRFLAHPVRLATALPSSAAMARMVAGQVDRPDGTYVVELGAGTGAVTRALLDAGIPADRLIAVELDDQMAGFLETEFPAVHVIHGSATEIGRLLPADAKGRVGAVVSGVPVSVLPLRVQHEFVDAVFSILPPGERFIEYTYRLNSPLPMRRLGLVGRRLAMTLRNLVPASVWEFRRVNGGSGED